jgi:thiol-disulfide isomerase/thioredoxin
MKNQVPIFDSRIGIFVLRPSTLAMLTLVLLSGCKQESDPASQSAVSSQASSAKPSLPNPPPGELDATSPSNSGSDAKLETAPRNPLDFTQVPGADATTPKGVLDYLANIDKSLKSVLIAAQQRRINPDEMMRQAASLSQQKLAAADKLESIASDDTQRELAMLARMEGYSHLAGMNDGQAADKLRELAPQAAKFQSEQVSHQASLVLLGLEVSDFSAGVSGTDRVLAQLDEVLKNPSRLKVPDFQACIQLLQVLDQHSAEEAVGRARQKIVAAFETTTDLQLAMQVWFLKVNETEEFAAFQTSLANRQSSIDEFESALQGLIKLSPSQWTLTQLTQNLVNVEYGGRGDKAASMVAMVKERLDLYTNPELRKKAESTLDQYRRRNEAVGKVMSFEGLQLEQDSQPIDPKSLVGKTLLIDFWASWCGPCRGEFPKLKEKYAKYRERGLEIVGINLDQDQQDMQQALQDENLPWIHARSINPEAVAFDTPQAVEFGVGPIPFMMLVGSDGKVAAVHTRGEVLDQRLAELFPE